MVRIEVFPTAIFLLELIITCVRLDGKNSRSKPRHISTQDLILNRITKLKKYIIPGLDTNLKQASEAISKILDDDIDAKINKAETDIESKIISTLDKRILQAAFMLKKSNDCRDLLQNCLELKESNVCMTSQEAMNKSCKKTCGFCQDFNVSLDDIISNVKYDIGEITQLAMKSPNRQKNKEMPQKFLSKSKPTDTNKKSVNNDNMLKKTHEKPKKIVTKIHKTHKAKKIKKPISQEINTVKTMHKCPKICKTNCLTGCPKICCRLQPPPPSLPARPSRYPYPSQPPPRPPPVPNSYSYLRPTAPIPPPTPNSYPHPSQIPPAIPNSYPYPGPNAPIPPALPLGYSYQGQKAPSGTTDCPEKCQEICSTDCPEVCCLQRFLIEMSKGDNGKNMESSSPRFWDKSAITNNVETNFNPGVSNVWQNSAPIEHLDANFNVPKMWESPAVSKNNAASLLIENPPMGFSCSGNCPKSCVPECTPECCSSTESASSISNQLMRAAIDDSMETALSESISESAKQYSNVPIDPSPNINTFKPIILNENAQTTVPPVERGQIYDLLQKFDEPQDNSDTCPEGCIDICFTECPKKCCLEPSATSNDISTDVGMEFQHSLECDADCEDHCTPSCLYNHCCKD